MQAMLSTFSSSRTRASYLRRCYE